MWQRLIFVLPLVLPTTPIKVPVTNMEGENIEETPTNKSGRLQQNPNIYKSDDSNVDSYLIPPDPHKPYEVLPDSVATLATYLLPPSAEQEFEYFYPTTEPGEQSDWYPIVHEIPVKIEKLPPLKHDVVPVLISKNNDSKLLENVRVGKIYLGDRSSFLEPSVRLRPPPITLDGPYVEINNKNPSNNNGAYDEATQYVPYAEKNLQQRPVKPSLALHLTPPKPLIQVQKTPTKLFPKKFFSGFKPVLIPISQFSGSSHQAPYTMPEKYVEPIHNAEMDYFQHPEDKKIFLYNQVEQKRQLKGKEVIQDEMETDQIEPEKTFIRPVTAEQETSETNHRYPRRKTYPTPSRHAAQSATHQESKSVPAPRERTEFRMHGMKGPNSYEFGYDTGKGKNRQFRFEERDNDGQVRGHYGYMDKYGKLQVVNYSAHPDYGFHADAPVVKE